MTPRFKILLRAKYLLALAGSSNPHEAVLARQRAQEHVAKHQITLAELDSLVEKPPTIRFVENLGDDSHWREQLAVEVAKRYDCKPLKARGRLFFDGEDAVLAISEYRRIVAKIVHDNRVVRTRGWYFDVRDGIIFVSGRYPGNYVTLFCARKKLPFRGDFCKFDDIAKSYTWAFEQLGPLGRGARLVFSSSEWDIIGEVTETGIIVVSLDGRVAKDKDGGPLHVEDDSHSELPAIRIVRKWGQ